MAIDPSILSEIKKDIEQQYTVMGYRPIVVLILMNEVGEVLLVQSAKNDSWWGFPQGGINHHEDTFSAGYRELREETGIPREKVSITQYCGTDQIDIPGWEERDGFKKGKRYYYILALCEGIDKINLLPEELAGYRWVSPQDVEYFLSTVNEEKRQSLLKALKNV